MGAQDSKPGVVCAHFYFPEVNMTDQKFLNIPVDEALHRQIKLLSSLLSTSVSCLVRAAVSELIEREMKALNSEVLHEQ